MTPDQKAAFARTFPVHVGVDTGKRFHVLVARGPDGLRRKPLKVLVSREGFERADAELQALLPDTEPLRMLIGLEFAGHHGFTFAHFLASRGYPIVNVLPAHTKRTKELEDNSPLKTDAKDAGVICKLVGDGTFVRFPFSRIALRRAAGSGELSASPSRSKRRDSRIGSRGCWILPGPSS